MKIQDKETFDKVNVFGLGQENSAFAQYFIGNSYLNHLHRRKRLVSGRRQSSRKSGTGNCHRDPTGSKTLARRQS